MKAKISIYVFIVLFGIISTSCTKEGMQGPAGQDAAVYYSEWFAPSAWSGASGDWYFDASAPDLTKSIVEGGVILSYVWLSGDLYTSTAVRPLPAYAIGANWSFLIHQYGSIEFTSDMIAQPGTSGNKFRFIAIPGVATALKSSSLNSKSANELRSMSYADVCKLYHIKEY